jgi:hypothetical protein
MIGVRVRVEQDLDVVDVEAEPGDVRDDTRGELRIAAVDEHVAFGSGICAVPDIMR